MRIIVQEVKKPDSFLFHHTDFVFRDKSEHIISFRSSMGATIHFTAKDQTLVSLSKSPFGGIAFVNNDNNTPSEIDTLFEQIEKYAVNNRIGSVQVTCCPLIYQPVSGEMLVRKFLEAGYSILHKDIAQVLMVSASNLKLNTLRRRCIRQNVDAGFVFYELTPNKLASAYQLFIESRKRKGYPVTMSLDDLVRMFMLFPQQYKLMGVYDGERLIAACVVIWVSSSILYYFFVGDDSKYRKFSPVTYLIENVYAYARSRGATLFDLGISTDGGVLNAGLYEFKKSFGAIDSAKYTFIKRFVQ